jgi:hypothetical protein
MQRYEYRICSVQYARVTFANGAWQGSVPPTGDQQAALDSCPQVWDYLQEAGRDGWELVAALAQQPQGATMEVLYLKRSSQ